jgi:hypothetical protein
MAADEQAGPVRAWVALAECNEDRMPELLRQPPTAEFSCAEVGERRQWRKHQTPSPELIGESNRFLILDIEAVRHPPPAGEPPMTAERLLTSVC